jgi:hypothetical protein
MTAETDHIATTTTSGKVPLPVFTFIMLDIFFTSPAIGVPHLQSQQSSYKENSLYGKFSNIWLFQFYFIPLLVGKRILKTLL